MIFKLHPPTGVSFILRSNCRKCAQRSFTSKKILLIFRASKIDALLGNAHIWAIPQKLVILEETGNFSKHYASKLMNLFLKCSIQKIKGGPIRIFSVPPLFFEISQVLGRKNALFLENNEKNFFSKCYRKKHYAYQVFGTKE